VGIDAAKAKRAVAVAEPGRSGEARCIGEIEVSPEAVRKLLTQQGRARRFEPRFGSGRLGDLAAV